MSQCLLMGSGVFCVVCACISISIPYHPFAGNILFVRCSFVTFYDYISSCVGVQITKQIFMAFIRRLFFLAFFLLRYYGFCCLFLTLSAIVSLFRRLLSFRDLFALFWMFISPRVTKNEHINIHRKPLKWTFYTLCGNCCCSVVGESNNTRRSSTNIPHLY